MGQYCSLKKNNNPLQNDANFHYSAFFEKDYNHACLLKIIVPEFDAQSIQLQMQNLGLIRGDPSDLSRWPVNPLHNDSHEKGGPRDLSRGGPRDLSRGGSWGDLPPLTQTDFSKINCLLSHYSQNEERMLIKIIDSLLIYKGMIPLMEIQNQGANDYRKTKDKYYRSDRFYSVKFDISLLPEDCRVLS